MDAGMETSFLRVGGLSVHSLFGWQAEESWRMTIVIEGMLRKGFDYYSVTKWRKISSDIANLWQKSGSLALKELAVVCEWLVLVCKMQSALACNHMLDIQAPIPSILRSSDPTPLFHSRQHRREAAGKW